MTYEYSGYLSMILEAPDISKRDDVDYVEFTAEDILHWATVDMAESNEWRKVRVSRSRIDDAVQLSGNFTDIHRMNFISPNKPEYWAPLGTRDIQTEQLPIDLNKFPIMEVEYRCTTQDAYPAILWAYKNGTSMYMLKPSQRWRISSRLVQHNEFPEEVTGLYFRLYGGARSKESFEIKSLRFRAMTEEEKQAFEENRTLLNSPPPDLKNNMLDDFVPLGVILDAEKVSRLSEMLGISTSEYWELTLEDVARHHHNCIAIENAERFSPDEWRELLTLTREYGVKLLPMSGVPVSEYSSTTSELIIEAAKMFHDSDDILAWSINTEPKEKSLRQLVQIRDMVAEVDQKHPFVISTYHPGKAALFGPCFSATAIKQFQSRNPWQVADTVRAHGNVCKGQHLWFVAPAFVGGCGVPEWSTCPELRLMVNSAFANGAQGFFTYMLHNVPAWLDGSDMRSLFGPFMTFSDLWQELDRRMERINAIAPLFLNASIEPVPEDAFSITLHSDSTSAASEGARGISTSLIAGEGYKLFLIVSNETRTMSSVNLEIKHNFASGCDVYDLSDFIDKRKWRRMNLERHLEMFPGQMRGILIAEPGKSLELRDLIAHRLMEDDQRQLRLNMRLAQQYCIDVSLVEEFIKGPRDGDTMKQLPLYDWARDRLLDLIYENPEISDSRSRIIETSAALCACDGALCKLHGKKEQDLARELGQKVVPLARELTNMRLELRHGRGKQVLDLTRGLARRALELLNEIRSHSSP